MSDAIVCSAGCKRHMPDQDAASAAGWECLAISTRWRCPDCTHELVLARDYVGTSGSTEEPK